MTMKHRLSRRPDKRHVWLLAGVMLLVSGYWFYMLFREGSYLHWLPALPVSSLSVESGITDWLPSFIFVLSFSFISFGLFHKRRQVYFWILLWTGIAVCGEMLQQKDVGAIAGVFDPLDIFAAIGAGVLSLFLLLVVRDNAGRESSSSPPLPLFRKFGKIGLALFGSACLTATSPYRDPDYREKPIYMSYEELREPLKGEGPVDIAATGKIYKYKDYILLNSPNEGIHIIDNSNPKKPRNIKFIDIPGNIDMAVKDDILYVDSFIDLVAIDISNIQKPKEVSRIEGVFPYDPYQVIGVEEDIWFIDLDEEKGVVVGYVR